MKDFIVAFLACFAGGYLALGIGEGMGLFQNPWGILFFASLIGAVMIAAFVVQGKKIRALEKEWKCWNWTCGEIIWNIRTIKYILKRGGARKMRKTIISHMAAVAVLLAALPATGCTKEESPGDVYAEF